MELSQLRNMTDEFTILTHSLMENENSGLNQNEAFAKLQILFTSIFEETSEFSNNLSVVNARGTIFKDLKEAILSYKDEEKLKTFTPNQIDRLLQVFKCKEVLRSVGKNKIARLEPPQMLQSCVENISRLIDQTITMEYLSALPSGQLLTVHHQKLLSENWKPGFENIVKIEFQSTDGWIHFFWLREKCNRQSSLFREIEQDKVQSTNPMTVNYFVPNAFWGYLQQHVSNSLLIKDCSLFQVVNLFGVADFLGIEDLVNKYKESIEERITQFTHASSPPEIKILDSRISILILSSRFGLENLTTFLSRSLGLSIQKMIENKKKLLNPSLQKRLLSLYDQGLLCDLDLVYYKAVSSSSEKAFNCILPAALCSTLPLSIKNEGGKKIYNKETDDNPFIFYVVFALYYHTDFDKNALCLSDLLKAAVIIRQWGMQESWQRMIRVVKEKIYASEGPQLTSAIKYCCEHELFAFVPYLINRTGLSKVISIMRQLNLESDWPGITKLIEQKISGLKEPEITMSLTGCITHGLSKFIPKLVDRMLNVPIVSFLDTPVEMLRTCLSAGKDEPMLIDLIVWIAFSKAEHNPSNPNLCFISQLLSYYPDIDLKDFDKSYVLQAYIANLQEWPQLAHGIPDRIDNEFSQKDQWNLLFESTLQRKLVSIYPWLSSSWTFVQIISDEKRHEFVVPTTFLTNYQWLIHNKIGLLKEKFRHFHNEKVKYSIFISDGLKSLSEYLKLFQECVKEALESDEDLPSTQEFIAD